MSTKESRSDARVALLRAARRRWLNCERLELNVLAAEVGISRATAYRWFGSNKHLQAEVVQSMVASSYQWARDGASGTGAARVVSILGRQLSAVMSSPAIKTWISHDTELALAILTTGEYPVSRTLVQQVEGLLMEEVARGELRLRADVGTLAFALARLMEGFAYADVVAGEPRKLEEAVSVFECLLAD